MTVDFLRDEFINTNVADLKQKYSKIQLTVIYNRIMNLKGSVGTSGGKEILIDMIRNKLN